ncbi:MAG: hypothetical protein IJ357_03450 [Oscillospiraceae bacterium]|nr:hypothetical protein [Oscillospiraceae bacterium]
MKLILILLLLAVMVSMFGLPFEEYPTGQLLPVKTVQVSALDGLVEIVTEVGRGVGESWAAAVADLRARAAGTVFFDTAEHVVLCGTAETIVPEALESGELRPAARVYYAEETVEPEGLSAWLDAHESNLTLGELEK